MQQQQQQQQRHQQQQQQDEKEAETPEWAWQLEQLVLLQQRDGDEVHLPVAVSQQVLLVQQQLLQRHGAAAAECVLQQLSTGGPGALRKIEGPLKLLLLRSSDGLRQLQAEGWLQQQLQRQALLLWGDTTAAATATAGATAATQQQQAQQMPLLQQHEQLEAGGLARVFCALQDQVYHQWFRV